MYRCLGRPYPGFGSSGSGFLRDFRTLGSNKFSKAIAVKVGMVFNGGILVYFGFAAM